MSIPTEHFFLPPAGGEAGWLICRRIRAWDVPALLSAVLASTEHLRPWMAWADPYDRAKAAAFVAMHAQENDRDGIPASELPYAMCDRQDRLLGLCGLHAMPKPGVLEIGYWV